MSRMRESEGGDRIDQRRGQDRIVDRCWGEEGRNGKGYDRKQR